ncbi:MAG: membrane protein insertase YidC [Bacteroidales bacterium]|nr:membrane protein insertase YidC [Bacteroidales bacterium]
MDKNTVIGLLLIFALFLGFSFYQTNQVKKQRAAQEAQMEEELQKEAEEAAKTLSLDNQTDTLTDSTTPAVTSLTPAQRFSNAQVDENGDYTVETAKAYYLFSKKGGYLKQIQLKDVYRYTPKDAEKQPLIIYDGGSNCMAMKLMLRDQSEISTADCYFVADVDELVVDAQHNKLSLRLYPNTKSDSAQCQVLDQKSYIEYLYTFSNDDYKFDYEINVVNMEPYLYPNRRNFTILWNAKPKNVEKNYDYEKNITSIYYMDNSDEVDNLDERKPDKKEFTSPLKWVSFKQQFFTTCLVTKDKPFTSGTLEVKVPEKSEKVVLKDCSAELDFELADLNKGHFDMYMFVGPNQYRLLKEYDTKLERQVPLGWGFFLLHWINRFIIIPVFNWLEAYGLSYGLIILILTIFIKIIVLPVSYKTYMSSAKMRALKPEIEAINEKYPKDEDMMKKQQATMSLYRSAGVKPAGGCLPMLLQMPILIAMYRFFPSAYELRQQPFLWAEDLSTYDSIWDFGHNVPLLGDHLSLFTILMTIATVVYTWLNQKLMAPTQGNKDQQRMMNIMMYMMPIMFLFMFNNFASALTYYYLLFNLLTFLQMWIFRMAIDEDKLRAEMQENMKKPVKKSKWQLKMEELQKQQQQMLKQQQSQKRK